MAVLRIEHDVSDFDSWKEAFDRDPVGRKRGGVRRFDVLRPVGEPNRIAVDLEFETAERAEAFHGLLRELWRTPQAAAVMRGGARVSVLEPAASGRYDGRSR